MAANKIKHYTPEAVIALKSHGAEIVLLKSNAHFHWKLPGDGSRYSTDKALDRIGFTGERYEPSCSTKINHNLVYTGIRRGL